jgi:hypothetical protein
MIYLTQINHRLGILKKEIIPKIQVIPKIPVNMIKVLIEIIQSTPPRVVIIPNQKA